MAVLADRQAFQKPREMRGFLNFTWLGPGAKHMHHACVREMHVIGRHHAWVDRSRSFGSPRPRLGFAPWGRFMGLDVFREASTRHTQGPKQLLAVKKLKSAFSLKCWPHES